MRPAALAAAVLTVALAVVPARGGDVMSCGSLGTYEGTGTGWLALHPEFPSGPDEVAYAVSPVFAPDTVYASNGRWVMRTDTGGCGWKPLLDVAAPIAGVLQDPLP